MDITSGLPRRVGLAGLTRVIRYRTSSVTVSRPSESKGSLDQTTTTTSDHTEDLWLFEPRENVSQELTGERIDGSLGGLAVSDGTVDLNHNDRVTHGGIEYEIDTIVGHPDDGDPDGSSSPDTDFWVISFTRRTA